MKLLFLDLLITELILFGTYPVSVREHRCTASTVPQCHIIVSCYGPDELLDYFIDLKRIAKPFLREREGSVVVEVFEVKCLEINQKGS